MDILTKLETFYRIIKSSSPLSTSIITAQEAHAERISEWLDITGKLETAVPYRQEMAEKCLEIAHLGAQELLLKGDEISAWLGQIRIAGAAERFLKRKSCVSYLADAALYSAYLFLFDHCQHFLNTMEEYLSHHDHALASNQCAIQGLSLTLQKRWDEAIPIIQFAIEHLQNATSPEIKKFFNLQREDLIADRTILLATCYLNIAWHTQNHDRLNAVTKARTILQRASAMTGMPRLTNLLKLKNIELLLLTGDYTAGQQCIQELLGNQPITSSQEAALRLGVCMLQARLSDLVGNMAEMLSYLTRALAESLLYPDAIQELILVDQALDLMRNHALDYDQRTRISDGMVYMLEAKDWYTGRDHSKCVSQYVLRIWDEWQPLRMDEATRENLFWAGYLHDIGKLYLPRSLLNKIAPLSREEWSIIQQHPDYGRKILSNFQFGPVAQWVSEHHQNVLGTGYPGDSPASSEGLCIGVADYLEAATSPNRKYRKPKTYSEAISDLKTFGSQKYPMDLLLAAEKIHHSPTKV